MLKSDKKISIYDTTLRDGAQAVGISFSLQDKLRIAKTLDKLKIDYIEGGWPGSNPKDDLFFQGIKNYEFEHSKIVAFGSTKRHKLTLEEDQLIQSLILSNAEILTIVAKSSDIQVKNALNISLEDNLNLIADTVSYLKDKNFKVFLDAEHFYDGFKKNPEYSLKCLEAATKAGADMVILCDTNGGTLSDEVKVITEKVVGETKNEIGVHFHNDSGVAVANSLTSIIAGATSIQGTMNGYGERCGNCDLTSIIPNIDLKMDFHCNAGERLESLTEISRFISETANLAHNERMPFVGGNSFTHKAGIHVSAILRDSGSYEHINPESVGNKRKIAVSELSGKSNIQLKCREMGIDIEKEIALPEKILKKIKCLEDKGFQFEAAEGSFELLIREATGEYTPFFILKGFRVITEMNENGELYCEGTIKVEVNNKIEHTAADGKGPVEAMDNALRKALEKFYPEIRDMHLTDYKVRVLDEKDATGSAVRVLIDQKDETGHWGTVGVSTNIIEASWYALVDGIEYMLFKTKNKK